MSTNAATIHPIGFGNVFKLLGLRPTPAPAGTAAIVPTAQDSYQRASGLLKNPRFAGNPELNAIASGRAILGVSTSPATLVQVQQALQDMAFMVPKSASGLYAFGTTAAIKNFQAFAGLPVDGSLGPNTLAALDRLAPPPGMHSWDQGADPGPVPSPDMGNGKKARVVVSISQHRAFLFDTKGNLEKIYGVRSGREQVDAQGKVGHTTHPGPKIITGKNDNPTEISNALWPESGGQAFGTRLLALRDYDPASGTAVKSSPWNGQDLHGTYQDSSVGRNFSHGCVGLRNQDIEEIFSQVKNGELLNFIA